MIRLLTILLALASTTLHDTPMPDDVTVEGIDVSHYQGDIDWSLIEANLKRSPEERIKSCQEAITQVSLLQTAMRQATHG